METLNFKGQKIHMIGIKGVGMTALVEILLNSGAEITGSDIKEEFHTDRVLKRLKIKPLDFNAKNIFSKIDLVVYSSAYGNNHIERQAAEKLGIRQISYAEALAGIFNQKQGIMIAGTHGKTTATALLGHIMIESGFDPTVLAGGTVINWQSNARIGKSDWMVIEGDEYQKKFLNFKPSYLLITNVDYDHPDTFPDKASYQAAFEALKAKTRLKYFDSGGNLPKIDPGNLIGRHILENIGLIMKLTRELGIADGDVQKAVKSFLGVRRRCEIYYQSEKLAVMDDYAHHPAEIKATLQALKERYPEWRIKVIFQPHTFSRTKAFFDDFIDSFGKADEVMLASTYSSARESEKTDEDIDKLLAEKLAKAHPSARFVGAIGAFDEEQFKKILGSEAKTILLTMGAGDVWQIARKLTELATRWPSDKK